MASALGLKNEPSASSMWARVKKKLYTEGGRSAASADGPASDADTKPNTSSKMKDSNVDGKIPLQIATLLDLRILMGHSLH